MRPVVAAITSDGRGSMNRTGSHPSLRSAASRGLIGDTAVFASATRSLNDFSIVVSPRLVGLVEPNGRASIDTRHAQG
jgi:hypothetical protein